MRKGSAPNLHEALQLVESLEAHCAGLRAGGGEMKQTAAELEQLVREIRRQLRPIAE